METTQNDSHRKYKSLAESQALIGKTVHPMGWLIPITNDDKVILHRLQQATEQLQTTNLKGKDH